MLLKVTLLILLIIFLSGCAKLQESTFCSVQHHAALDVKRVGVFEDVRGEQTPDTYTPIDDFEGHRTVKAEGVVVTVARSHGVSYQSLTASEQEGHWAGELISLQLTAAQLSQMEKAPLLLTEEKISLSIRSAGDYHFYPYVIAKLTPKRQSYVRSVNQKLQGTLYITAAYDKNWERQHFGISFSCEPQPMTMQQVDNCMGPAPSSGWHNCKEIKQLTETSERKFCWNFPSDCAKFLTKNQLQIEQPPQDIAP